MVRYFSEGPRPPSLKPELFAEERISPIPGALVVPRRVFATVGLFDPEYRLAMDVDWVGRVLDAGWQLCEFRHLVLLKRIHGANLSLNAAENTVELLRLTRSKLRAGRAKLSASPKSGE